MNRGAAARFRQNNLYFPSLCYCLRRSGGALPVVAASSTKKLRGRVRPELRRPITWVTLAADDEGGAGQVAGLARRRQGAVLGDFEGDQVAALFVDQHQP